MLISNIVEFSDLIRIDMVFFSISSVTENFVYIGAKDQGRDGEFTWITSGRHAGSYSYPGSLFGFHNSKTCASFSERRAALHAEDCSNTLKPLCQARMK